MCNVFWTKEKIQEWLNNNTNGYSVLELKYVGNHILYTRLRCPNVFHESFCVSWNSFMNGSHLCAQCKRDANMSIENMQIEIDKIVDNYKVYDVEMQGTRKLVFIKCPVLDHKPYWTEARHILNGHICKKCSNEKNYTESIAIKYCKEKGFVFKGFGESNTNRAERRKIAIQDSDGYLYYVSYESLRSKKSIKYHKMAKNPYAVFNMQNWCKQNRPDYEFIDNSFRGYKKPHLFKYCGDFFNDKNCRVFYCNISDFVESNVEHPLISMSSYARKVYKFLYSLDIYFESEKTFENFTTRTNSLYRFDFYLPEFNTCIEVNGKQHYEFVEYFHGTIDKFKERQEDDNIKKKYCLTNKINYIEIPYWEFENDNYKNILKKELNL